MNAPLFPVATTPVKLKLRVEDFLLLDRNGRGEMALAGPIEAATVEGLRVVLRM